MRLPGRVSLHWQISAGQLFDVLLPAAGALAIICSTCVLADARRRALRPVATTAWTLGTLALPFTVLPLYLLARLWRRARPKDNEPEIIAPPVDVEAAPQRTPQAQTRFLLRHALPLIYAVSLTALGALFFQHYYFGLDGHLARASNAKLHEQHARAVSEYRAALRLNDDPHTHKQLGLELVASGQWAAALGELRTAEQGGEPDAALPFHIANALAALARHAEAVLEYQRFLGGDLCTQSVPDERCQSARARIAQQTEQTPAN